MKNIVLLCNQGMSTSILVKKMQAAAEAENYECSIAAFPTSEAREKAADADIILLGPQVRFQQKKVAEQCPGRPVELIDMKLYGRMDGAGILKFAREKLGE